MKNKISIDSIILSYLVTHYFDTNKALAKELSCSTSTITRVINNKRKLGPVLKMKVIKILESKGISDTYILEHQKKPGYKCLLVNEDIVEPLKELLALL